MTLIICILVLASIASMAMAFLAAARLEASVQELEHRTNARLSPPVVANTETESGKGSR